MRKFALALLTVAFAACGSETTTTGTPPGTNLLVKVDADGPHGSAAAKTARVRCPGARCTLTKQLRTRDFAPIPPGQACSMIYGGPETATVKGTLRGDAIDARFSRTDGCQTSRWQRVQRLLSAAR
jgi:hypothetical protein